MTSFKKRKATIKDIHHNHRIIQQKGNEQLSGRKPVLEFTDWRPADQKVYVTDFRKAARVLGWRPSIGWREGLRRLYGWMLENVGMNV
ncbi:MAG: GDP-mannose 4,6-dehydratase [Candidatus Caldarchaeum sp.]